MLKTGEKERGRKEIEGGLKVMDDTLEYIAADRVYGFLGIPKCKSVTTFGDRSPPTLTIPS
jgi:hypothetical protein